MSEQALEVLPEVLLEVLLVLLEVRTVVVITMQEAFCKWCWPPYRSGSRYGHGVWSQKLPWAATLQETKIADKDQDATVVGTPFVNNDD